VSFTQARGPKETYVKRLFQPNEITQSLHLIGSHAVLQAEVVFFKCLDPRESGVPHPHDRRPVHSVLVLELQERDDRFQRRHPVSQPFVDFLRG
jgi:hypothetical protein